MYERFERHFQKKFRVQMPNIRLIESVQDAQLLEKRMLGNPTYEGYVEKVLKPAELEPYGYRSLFGAALVTESGYVDVKLLLRTVDQYLQARECVQEGRIEASNVTVAADHAVVGGTQYRHVIFCEGAAISFNPWFKAIPFRHVKGESLLIEADLPRECLLTTSSALYVLPVGERRFHVGGTYDWANLDFVPTPEGRRLLLERLATVYSGPVTVLEQLAGVRPVGRNRLILFPDFAVPLFRFYS